MVSRAVTPVKFPVRVEEEIGRDDNPDSPVTDTVTPPSFTQVPLASLVIDDGTFQPFESPKYLVAPTVNSLIKGV